MYGDNWFNDVKFEIQFLKCEPAPDAVQRIQQTESKMSQKKTEMQRFQTEFLAAKKAYDEACEKLKNDTEEIQKLFKDRDAAYNDYKNESKKQYAASRDIASAQQNGSSAGGIWGLFGSK